MKLSIIIPVYNVEKYINKCLYSCIFEQDVKEEDYEIIIINDGTKDNSMILVDQVIKDKPNVVVVNKVNGGLSSARNAGLSIASGEYIWFVDSDDTIAPFSISRALKYIDQYKSEVLFFDIRIKYENGSPDISRKMYNSNSALTKDGYLWLGEALEMWPMAQMYLFKRAFLQEHKLFFKEGILHEDVEFKYRMLLKAHKVTYVPDVLYNYLIRDSGSISSNYSPKRAKDLLWIINDEYEIYKVLDERILKSYSGYALFRNVDNYMHFTTLNRDMDSLKKMIELKSMFRDLLRYSFGRASFGYKVKMILAAISPRLVICIYRLRSSNEK